MTNRPMHEVMHRRSPVTLHPEATVQEACVAMRNHRVGAVMVIDHAGGLLGIFTGRDAVGRMLAEARDPCATRLAEVMTRGPACLGPHHTAIEALRLMRDSGFRHVPVVHGGQLLGIVSRGDFHGHETARLDEESVLWERL
jgi:CBS domain-containing protein